MNDLYRFVALRAPARTNPKNLVALTSQSEFQQGLAKLRSATPPAPRMPAARSVVEGFAATLISDVDIAPYLNAFDDLYSAAQSATTRPSLSTAIKQAFGNTPQQLIADSDYQAFFTKLQDSIVAVFINPAVRTPPLADLVRLARLANLITRVAAGDGTLDDLGEIQSALNATVVLPPLIFPLNDGLPQPVGVGDLLVVKQQLKRYEAGDLANIENILRGESRKKVTRHSLTTDTTTSTTTSKTTETTNSLDVMERFELKNEVQNTVQEDLSANAGLSVSAKYGAVEVTANANVAYSLSKQESTQAATDRAKEVTKRAASKVTESITRTETLRTIEKLLEAEDHSFDNTKTGASNISGVYQWLNKIYEAQIYNYGARLMFDLTVPEPAAFVLDALTVQGDKDTPVAPEPFVLVRESLTYRPVLPDDLASNGTLKPALQFRPITPADLSDVPADDLYFGNYVAKYGATSLNAPPEAFTTVSKGITANKDDHDHLASADEINIPQGYQASEVNVRGGFALYEQEDGDEALFVSVGRQQFNVRGQGSLNPATAIFPAVSSIVDEQGTIPVAIESTQARDFAIAIDIKCVRTDAALQQWKLDTHAILTNAYAKLWTDYQDKLTAQKIQVTSSVSLGQNPDQNRTIEKTELKKACIGLLSGVDLYTAGFDNVTVNASVPAFPRVSVPALVNAVVGDQAAFIRFFEQAFEWEHISYLFYPYYWGRSKTWYDSAITDNPDPLFAEFLKAGAARVVVPVRPQLEGDVRYFLMTGELWGGGAMPGITDSDYLPITEEIKARDDASGEEIPQGDPWEVSVPTTLIRLRDDDSLPVWEKFTVDNGEVWVPGRIVKSKWVPDYGKLDVKGNWSPP